MNWNHCPQEQLSQGWGYFAAPHGHGKAIDRYAIGGQARLAGLFGPFLETGPAPPAGAAQGLGRRNGRRPLRDCGMDCLFPTPWCLGIILSPGADLCRRRIAVLVSHRGPYGCLSISDPLFGRAHDRKSGHCLRGPDDPADDRLCPGAPTRCAPNTHHIAPYHLSDDALDFAQTHLRMLSGLYGLLRPLDLMMPYRLEMGIRLKNERGTTLYQFWGDRITQLINDDLKHAKTTQLTNLA